MRSLVVMSGRIGVVCVLMCVAVLNASAQFESFPHPELEWRTIETEHFLVHYHNGAERTGRTVAKIAEEVYEPVTAMYNHKPDQKVSIAVYDVDDIANGAADLAAATDAIKKLRRVERFLIYGISSGALRAALFAQNHPERVSRLALDAFVWTGEGAPTLEQRRKKLPEFMASKRRPIDRAFVRSIFSRDHADCADAATVEAFADAILALDDSMPNGTYIDMCSRLPLVDPLMIRMPTVLLRGQFDGIAAFDDLIEFFKRLPHPDKQFTVLNGISHASFQQKNYKMVYQILHAWFTQPEPAYTDYRAIAGSH